MMPVKIMFLLWLLVSSIYHSNLISPLKRSILLSSASRSILLDAFLPSWDFRGVRTSEGNIFFASARNTYSSYFFSCDWQWRSSTGFQRKIDWD